MNIVRKITFSIFKKNNWKGCASIRLKHFKIRNLLSLPYSIKCFQIAIASTLIPQGKINVEDDLRKAVQEGEAAVLDLMNQLQDLVISVSKEYRSCLTKQIEIIKTATTASNEAWDKLPEFRTKASELSNELNAYLVLLRTIGEIAYDQTLISLKADKNSLQVVLKKYNELEKILQNEFKQNKLKEQELLEANIKNILSDIKS